MNKKLQRLNEARRYARQIRAKYGDSAEVCDCPNGEWYIYTPSRVALGMWGVQDRVHWRGKSLRESL